MREVPFSFRGRTYHLLLNGAALFALYDRFGTEGDLLDPLQGRGRESFEALCDFLQILAEEGELYRRWRGLDIQEIPSAEMFRLELRPMDAVEARRAVIQAVQEGFRREEAPPSTEVDVGLLELQKKTGTP